MEIPPVDAALDAFLWGAGWPEAADGIGPSFPARRGDRADQKPGVGGVLMCGAPPRIL
jgi:hypothetical protein